jgi:hypothetical protein
MLTFLKTKIPNDPFNFDDRFEESNEKFDEFYNICC